MRLPWAPLLFVAAVHAATTAGTWVASDHAEQLTQARRLLTRGTLVLGGPGERIPELSYWPVRADRASRSRLYPGTAVAYLPFVAADAVLGLDRPDDFGPLAAGAGHVYALLALALLARVALVRGAPVGGVAPAIALVGTAWPVWQVARHAGSEPVLAAAFALGLLAHERRHPWTLALTCAALPWVHPTGVVVATALAGTSVVDGSAAADRWFGPRTGLPAAALSFAALLAWNAATFGHALAGGYAGTTGGGHYVGRDPLGGAIYYLTESVRLAPLVLLPLVACGVAPRRRALAAPALMLGLHVVLFGVLSQAAGQEPGRRLAIAWFAALPALAFGWERMRPGFAAGLSLLLAAVAWGLLGFWATEAHYFPADDGTFLPLVWWLVAARAGTPEGAIAASLGLLGAVAVVAGQRTLRLAAADSHDTTPR